MGMHGISTRSAVIIILAASLAWVAAWGKANADLYEWTDENGIPHYTNIAPPPDCSGCRILKETKTRSPDPSPAPPVPAFNIPKSPKYRVTRVFDGDSILVKGQGLTLSVRLVGIDAPETSKRGNPGQPFSNRSRQMLYGLVYQKQIQLVSHGKDRFNRQLAQVFYEGKNINLEMIRHGLAEVYRGKLPGDLDAAAFIKAQENARSAMTGIWGLGGAYESPREWRRKYPYK